MTDRRMDRIQAQIDALQSELAKIATQPVDDFDEDTVIMFTKDFPPFGRGPTRQYTYTALKAGGTWWLTGRPDPETHQRNKTWDQLCDFIGDFDHADVWYATEWERL